MPLNSNSDTNKLILELSQGNESAFTILYDQYKHIVYSAALKITKSKILAEETVQDVFLKIWENHKNLADITNIENYLFIIARNHIFTTIKKISRDTAMNAEVSKHLTSFNNTDTPVSDDQYNVILNQILDQLPPQQQKIYKMAKWEGMSHQKIGEDLGISTATVKKHMAQALKFIRTKISPYINIFITITLLFNLCFNIYRNI